LTQQQLAEAVGLSRNTIVNFETGRRIPRMDDISKIAEALGVDPVAFFANPTIPREASPGESKRKTGKEPVKRDRRKPCKTA
jgi:transcriptional regulator with XRE-family HTH domain